MAWLHVPKATSGFHAVDGHVYVREETSNRRLSPQEIVHFAYVKGFSKADIEKVNVDFRLLDTTLFEQWRQNRGIERTSVEETLEKTGLALRVGAQLLPTRAAVLLLLSSPMTYLIQNAQYVYFNTKVHQRKLVIHQIYSEYPRQLVSFGRADTSSS